MKIVNILQDGDEDGKYSCLYFLTYLKHSIRLILAIRMLNGIGVRNVAYKISVLVTFREYSFENLVILVSPKNYLRSV